jgi:hypothetical protein
MQWPAQGSLLVWKEAESFVRFRPAKKIKSAYILSTGTHAPLSKCTANLLAMKAAGDAKLIIPRRRAVERSLQAIMIVGARMEKMNRTAISKSTSFSANVDISLLKQKRYSPTL